MNNGYIDEEKAMVINNEYDFSNIVPTIESVIYLVEYCDNILNKFLELVAEDEEKNKQYKDEYRTYNFKKVYGQYLNIYIREKTYNNVTCENLKTFLSAINDGNLKNVNGLDIKLSLNFSRGKGRDLVEHENSFDIIFKPYEIKFARKSNHNENMMNQIENNINEILNKFPKINTIFCSK